MEAFRSMFTILQPVQSLGKERGTAWILILAEYNRDCLIQAAFDVRLLMLISRAQLGVESWMRMYPADEFHIVS